MAFEHVFVPISKHMVEGKVVALGPWACVSDAGGYAFGEQWERSNSRDGRKIVWHVIQKEFTAQWKAAITNRHQTLPKSS